ncbi:hypothetical protein HCN44_005083 [Aphidius gifuensis]|uniref:Uncharacterized protein n=1 Tax=Aphidius gifuensis TaxID=684658 RepID=A0A834XX18_APHGI|nr:hypothetical protein HCN44_005083 [Aphidius gifuensis]
MAMILTLTFGIFPADKEKISIQAKIGKPLIINIPDITKDVPLSGCLFQNIKDPESMSINMVYYFAFIDDIENNKQMYGAAMEVAGVSYNGDGGNCSLVINNATEIFIDEWRVRSELDLDFNSRPLNYLNLTINFFEKPMIRGKLHKLMNTYFSDNPLFDNDDDLEESWRLYIFDQIRKSIEIPGSLKNDVSLLSRSLIQELIEFLQKIFINLEKDQQLWYPSLDDYFEKIKWKKNGKIDEVNTYLNIYKERWSATKTVNDKYMFLEACKYCLEGSVTMTWMELSTTKQEHIVNNVLNGKYNYMANSVLSAHELETRHLVFYWRWKMGTFSSTVLRLKKKSNLLPGEYDFASESKEPIPDSIKKLNIEVRDFDVISESDSLDYENVDDGFNSTSVILHTIPTSIEKTNVVAIQYLIDADLKNEIQNTFVESKVYYWLSKRKEKQSIYYDDMLLFLMRQMENFAISRLCAKYKLEILDTLVESWPGKYLFLNLFAADYGMTTEIYRSLFAHILKTIRKEYNLIGKKNLTSFWLLSEFLQKYGYFLEDEPISDVWSLPVLSKETKLIAIAFIASIPNIKKTNPSQNQKAIDDTFKSFGKSFLTNKKYDVLSDYLNYMMISNNEKKIEFIKSLEIDLFYINLLEYTDDSESSQLFDFYDWLNAIGETTTTTKIINDSLSSNKILQEKHDSAYQEYSNTIPTR